MTTRFSEPELVCAPFSKGVARSAGGLPVASPENAVFVGATVPGRPRGNAVLGSAPFLKGVSRRDGGLPVASPEIVVFVGATVPGRPCGNAALVSAPFLKGVSRRDGGLQTRKRVREWLGERVSNPFLPCGFSG